ncbi:hypothetical protein BGZ73_006481 [Actinomortierella ambigua]|nr:hypothetical protein BGZ73_006481 [Actinomortierella ambigua]
MEVTLDASLTDEILYARFTRALNDCNIDEFGILPFVPDTRDTRPEWHPFLVDDSQTKLGMPMVCWAPLIGAAYGVLKPIVNRRCEEGSQPWWENQRNHNVHLY